MEDVGSHGRIGRFNYLNPDHINALRSPPILPLPLALETFPIQNKKSSLGQKSKRRPCGSLINSNTIDRDLLERPLQRNTREARIAD
ncbi:uncharacterized protein N7518_003345 [Penicillium psychrosexuale]|uniref:uncharacterized protein n=1 Tax=Penicillium psychrosexuale TaxID=1002107 RepID=UPI0025453B18|nr:uncharacterized protein N7518_003345 [Penicillium psychrosexuale]KAJ5801277.1 hypothetical protein N7518_003345 [Penicillium psychrosexuale]